MATNPWAFYDEAYQTAAINEGGTYTPPPDGVYQVKVLEYLFDLERGILKRKYEVITGEYTSRKVLSFLHFKKKNGEKNEVAMNIFKTEINNLDVDFKDLSASLAIPAFLNAVQGQLANIYVKNQQYEGKWSSSVYVNEFLTTKELPF